MTGPRVNRATIGKTATRWASATAAESTATGQASLPIGRDASSYIARRADRQGIIYRLRSACPGSLL
jgi:hypothetical protein